MKRASRSGIPVKSASNPSPAPANSSSSQRALIFSSATPSEMGCEEVKKFCVEGTPSWMSKSNSNTNLSALTVEDEQETSSDDSEGDDILQGCIKTAWPAKKQPPKVLKQPKII